MIIIISKKQGVMLTFFVIMPFYIVPYYWFVMDTVYALKLTLFFATGVQFLFLRNIEAGTRAELVFGGKATGYFWDDGHCYVPSILNFLHFIHIYLLWNLKKPITEEDYFRRDIGRVQHAYDQSSISYVMHSKPVSAGKLTLMSLFGKIFARIFFFWRGDPELLYQRLGTMIMLVALVLGWSAHAAQRVGNTARQAGATFSQFTSAATTERRQTYVETRTTATTGLPLSNVTQRAVQPVEHHNRPKYDIIPLSELGQESMPMIPSYEDFTPRNSWSTFLIGERRYVRYKDVPLGQTSNIRIDQPYCMVVPAGRSIGIMTNLRPIFVLNMQNRVAYFQRSEKEGEQSRRTESNWKTFYDDWYLADNEFLVIAEALPLGEIPEERRGGLVCF